MQKLLLSLFLILFTLTASAQNKRCVGGDTLCMSLLPDTSVCSATKLEFIAAASSSVTTANIIYQWTDLTNTTTLSSKDSLNHIFSSSSVTSIDVEIHAQYDTFHVYDTFKITINPLPTISANQPYLAEICFVDSIHLNTLNITPSGGAWHHWSDTTAIRNNYFLAAKLGNKNTNAIYDITYTVTNNHSCIDSLQSKVKLIGLPVVQLTNDTLVCNESNYLDLYNIIKRPKVPWLGNQSWTTSPAEHVIARYPTATPPLSQFIPQYAPANNNLVYNYTDIISGCSDSDSITISVSTAPTITFSTPNPIICANSDSNILDEIFQPNITGGKWVCRDRSIINPISNDSTSIDLSSKPNGYSYSLKYIYTQGPCIIEELVRLRTLDAPSVSITAERENVCETDNFIKLFSNPTGGNWFGDGVIDSFFHIPMADSITTKVWYTYTDPTSNCYDTDTLSIRVWNNIKLDLTTVPSSICDDDVVTIKANYSDSDVSILTWSTNGYGSINSFGDLIYYSPDISDTLTPVKVYANASNPGCADVTKSASFSVINCSKTSINKTEQASISIYPNPASDKLVLEKTSPDKLTVTLQSIDGKLLQTHYLSETQYKLTIHRNKLPAGIYYLIITDEHGNQKREKVIFE